MSKILIGIPCYKTITSRTAFSLIELIKQTKEQEIQVLFQDGVFVHQNQNNIIDFAVENNYDYIFLIETDMIFEPETLNKLLADDKDIICANYNFRSEPRCSMVFNEKLEHFSYKELPKETFKCGAIPTGLTLIKTSVFSKIKKPYFFYEYNEDGQMKTSQDVYFSLKVKEAGLSVWCNPLIETAHLGEQLF